jgi:DNA polymerase-3 subunit gamma/tau
VPFRAASTPARDAFRSALRRPPGGPSAGPASPPGPGADRAPARDVERPTGERPAPELPAAELQQAELAQAERAAPEPSAAATPAFDGDWPALVARVPAGGMAAQFLQQSALIEYEGLAFRLRVPIRPLAEPATVNRARDALAAHFGREVRLNVEVGAVDGPTAAAVATQRRAEQQADAQAAIEADPFVQALLNDFDGSIVPGSVRPSAPKRPSGE